MIQALVIHNILWSKYKAGVFSALSGLQDDGLTVEFVQIAPTARERQFLNTPDLGQHRYRYKLLFDVPFERIGFLQMSSQLVSTVRNSACRLVVLPGFDKAAYWCLLAFCKLTQRKVILTLDSTLFDNPQVLVKTLLKQAFVRFCDGAICYGQRSRSYLESLGMPSSRIHTRVQAASEGLRALAAAPPRGAAGAGNFFLFVGRLAKEKGIEDLIEAFESLAARFTEVELVIAGDGPLRDYMEDRARNSEYWSRISLIGPVDEGRLASLYYSAISLVLPSHSEPWGLVANEALMFGCPVVASDRCGCVPELIEDGVTGRVFAAGNVVRLTGCLESMMLESDSRARVSARCRARVAPFTASSSAEQMKVAILAIASRN